LKEDVKEIKVQIASLQEGQFELVKSLGNLRGVYENLKKSAADFKVSS